MNMLSEFILMTFDTKLLHNNRIENSGTNGRKENRKVLTIVEMVDIELYLLVKIH